MCAVAENDDEDRHYVDDVAPLANARWDKNDGVEQQERDEKRSAYEEALKKACEQLLRYPLT